MKAYFQALWYIREQLEHQVFHSFPNDGPEMDKEKTEICQWISNCLFAINVGKHHIMVQEITHPWNK